MLQVDVGGLTTGCRLWWDPTIRQPGFDLPLRKRSLLNRLRTGQAWCEKRVLVHSELCASAVKFIPCYILLNYCPLNKLDGGRRVYRQLRLHRIPVQRIWPNANTLFGPLLGITQANNTKWIFGTALPSTSSSSSSIVQCGLMRSSMSNPW